MVALSVRRRERGKGWFCSSVFPGANGARLVESSFCATKKGVLMNTRYNYCPLKKNLRRLMLRDQLLFLLFLRSFFLGCHSRISSFTVLSCRCSPTNSTTTRLHPRY